MKILGDLIIPLAKIHLNVVIIYDFDTGGTFSKAPLTMNKCATTRT